MKEKKKRKNFRETWDSIKQPNIFIMGVPESEEKKKTEKYSKK